MHVKKKSILQFDDNVFPIQSDIGLVHFLGSWKCFPPWNSNYFPFTYFHFSQWILRTNPATSVWLLGGNQPMTWRAFSGMGFALYWPSIVRLAWHALNEVKRADDEERLARLERPAGNPAVSFPLHRRPCVAHMAAGVRKMQGVKCLCWRSGTNLPLLPWRSFVRISHFLRHQRKNVSVWRHFGCEIGASWCCQ